MFGWTMLLAAAAAGNCGDKDNQTAMSMCQAQVAAQADREMNRVWAQVYPVMQQADRDYDRPKMGGNAEPGFAAALLASQRAWLAFRDAQCRIESYEWRGGTMQPFRESQCLTDVTLARTRQLRATLTSFNQR
ncbi:lysozyme inhibitor LprI family protein [Sphingomonas sp. ASY06-1R]|jgi:uncharacterized protein YecT (DUF1311 family)|uniref:lysozyme inhibitor LprI family protein n=1 Tax=Sphingomonas sp. ASY06-1R TaxID=3445771 RepID=UPI003FA2CFA8